MVVKAPILVAGAQRTGSSLIAGLIAEHGVDAGRCRTANPKYSAKSMYENKALKQLMKEALAENGLPVLYPSEGGWPAQLTSRPDWRSRVIETFPQIESGEPWIVKEVRILATWPLWREAFPYAIFVFPRADKDDVVRSMLRHHALQVIGDEDRLRSWVDICWARQDEIAAAGDNHIFVDADKLARGDLVEARRLIELLGLQFNEQLTKEWIDPTVWRQSETVGVRLARGLWFPDTERLKKRADYRKPKQMDYAMTHVRRYGLAIDAGAHIGVWARSLAVHFAEVIAIEPEPVAFHCLVRNSQPLANVRALDGGSIDSLQLDAVDFIRADIDALKGARETLKRCRPTVLIPNGGGSYLKKLGALRVKVRGRAEIWRWR